MPHWFWMQIGSLRLMKWSGVLPHNTWKKKLGNTGCPQDVWREKGPNSFKEEFGKARLGRSEKSLHFSLLNMTDLTEQLAQEDSIVQSGGSWVAIPQNLFLHICIISHSIGLIISFWLLRETGCATLNVPFIWLNALIYYFALVAHVFPPTGYLTVLA